MTSRDDLYTELKPDIDLITSPLFEASETFLRKYDNFLPHAAILTGEGTVELVGAVPDTQNDLTTSTVVLPQLHAGLRNLAGERPLKAIGIAENVTVTLEGKKPTKAIKVLFEHKRGLTVALYLPYQKKLLHGYDFGTPIAIPAEPETNAWGIDVI